jgi:hypothetical protein
MLANDVALQERELVRNEELAPNVNYELRSSLIHGDDHPIDS